MWFKNATIYTLPAPFIGAAALSEKLEPLAFEPGTTLDMQRQGWVPPRAGGGLVHAVDQQYLLALRSEKKLLPASVVNQAAKARAQDIEEQQGFKPGRKQMREIKEAVTDELLPKSHSIWRDTRVWIDAKHGRLVIDSATQAKCDEVMQLLNKSIDRLGARPLQTTESPVSAMTNWLAADETPAGFTIDQDSELRSSAQSKATVRYVRHAIDTEDVRRHIAAGKQCTRLALTWADRISFVLTEGLTLKRITPLDVLRENVDGGQDEAERFDADFALMAGEMRRAIDDLVDALGGHKGACDMQLKIKKLHPDVPLPTYATAGAACFDIRVYAPGADAVIMERCSATFPTGLAFEVPEGFVMLVFSRSGHGFRNGIRLANCVGVIDSDYRGELFVRLTTDDQRTMMVAHGDRIAQAMLVAAPRAELIEASELPDTERGTSGFGSTGA